MLGRFVVGCVVLGTCRVCCCVIVALAQSGGRSLASLSNRSPSLDGASPTSRRSSSKSCMLASSARISAYSVESGADASSIS